MARKIDLVADVGESFGAWTMGDDDALLDVLTSANVACGFHAGDPRTMDRTVAHCAARGIRVGAHPSFPDLVGFGRRAMDLSADEVRTDVLYQLGALQAFAVTHATTLSHVTPHGRLGNLVATRADYAAAVVDAIRSFDPTLIVLAQAGELADYAREQGIRVAIVGVVDRAYRADGTLMPRSAAGAVIHDTDELVRRAVRLVTEGIIDAVEGAPIPVEADTLLLHGDNADAVRNAKAIRTALTDVGVEIVALAEVLADRAERETESCPA